MRAFLDRVRRDRRAWWAGGGVGVVLLSGILIFVGLASADDPKAAEPSPTATSSPTRTPTRTPTLTPSPTPVPWAGILDGTVMTDEEWNARKDLLPVAVMMDNTPNSAPQAGLGRADLVYEAFVEGGITRLMAVYWRQEADLLMPVRSARTPFVIWVDELGALYAHAGNAVTTNEANAQGQLIEWGIFDLNAFTPGPSTAYYRDQQRYAPYNLATSTAWLREAAARLGFAGPPRVEPWKFKADGGDTADLQPAGGIQIHFQERPVAWQTVQWKWDEATKSYLRFQFGGPVLDATTNEQVRFRNVVVMRVPWRRLATSHVVLDQIGAGEATIFLDGIAIAGTWKKDDRRGRTRFYDSAGNEVAFNRGPIWIEVVGPASEILVTATAGDLPALPRYVPPPPGSIPETPDDDPTPATPEPTEVPTEAPTATPTVGTPVTASPTAGATPETSTPPPTDTTPATSETPGTSPTTEE